MKRIPRFVVVAYLALFGLLWPSASLAWKPTTHQVNARAAAFAAGTDTSLPPDLRGILWEKERWVRAGSMGPDLFIALLKDLNITIPLPTLPEPLPPLPPQVLLQWKGWSPSDLAHYCRTAKLALKMIEMAKTPEHRAFAYGWLHQAMSR